jgi:outer membrane protein assembly factor BamB
VLKTIDLGSGPEFCVADGKGMVYVNIEATGEIVGIDTRSLTIKSRWSLKPAVGGLSALAMDREHRRLFSSGRMPAAFVVVNADTGKVIQSFPISDGVDANAYDPSTGLIFVSTRAGKLHIFHEDSPDKYSEAQTVETEVGAKTLGLDTKTHHVFVDTSDFETPAPTQEHPHPRPVGKAGTFRVLVYAP